MARKLRFLVLLLSVVSICEAAIFNPISDSHRSAALELFTPVDGSLPSLEETYEALRYFEVLGLDKRNEIKASTCPTVVDTLSSSTTAPRDLFQALRVIGILKCDLNYEVFKGIGSRLKDSLKEANTLNDFYYSIGSLKLIKDQAAEVDVRLGDADGVIRSIKAFGQSDGRWRYSSNKPESSNHAAGIALETLGGVISLASQEIDQSLIDNLKKDVVKLFDGVEKYDDGSCYFDEKLVDAQGNQGPISASSSIARGVTAFATSISDENMNLPGDKLLCLAKFFLGIGIPGNPKDTYHQIDALAHLENNRISVPLILSLQASVLSFTRKDQLKVRVSTVLGSAAPSLSVKLRQIFTSDSKDASIIDQELKFDPKTGLHILETLPKNVDIGHYTFSFEILLHVPEDKRIYATGGRIKAPVYVTGIVKTDPAEIAILDSDIGSVETKKKLDLSGQNSIALQANHLQKLQLSFQLTTPLGHAFGPHQAFFRLTHESGVEHIFLVGNSGKKFEIILDFLGLVEKFFYLSGRYDIQLTVGDSVMENSFLQPLGYLELDLPNPPEKAARPPPQPSDPYSRYGPKEEITLIFRSPEKSPPRELSLTFLGLVLLPFVGLLAGLLSLRVNLSNFPKTTVPATFAVLFHAGIAAVLSLYFLFRLKRESGDLLDTLSMDSPSDDDDETLSCQSLLSSEYQRESGDLLHTLSMDPPSDDDVETLSCQSLLASEYLRESGDLLHTLSMDSPSDDDDETLSCPFLLASEDQRESGDRDHEAPYTKNALPYEYLLREVQLVMLYNDGRIVTDFLPLQRKLRFQQMVFMFLKNMVIFTDHWVLSVELDRIQSMAETAAEPITEAALRLSFLQGTKAHRFYYEEVKYCKLKFLNTIDQKVEHDLKEFCLGNVNHLLRGNSSREYKILEFLDVILLELKDLQISKPSRTVLVKKQMKILVVMLHFISKIVGKETYFDENLLACWPWVDMAAAVVIMNWVDVKDEKLVAATLQRINLSILELPEKCIAVIKALKPSTTHGILMMRETVWRVTNTVLENLIVSTYDRFQMLKEGLTLCIALLMDPPHTDAEHEKPICARINLQVNKAESLIRSLYLDKLGDDIVDRRNILLNDFLEQMNKAKAEVGHLHVEILGLSWDNIPQTNGSRFFDFLLGNLQKKLESKVDMFPFENHLIAEAHKELSLLRPFLMDIFLLQDEHKELRNIWIQASNMAYLVDYVTDSCFSYIDVPIWSNMVHLSNAIEQIQLVRTKVTNIRKNDQMYANKVISASKLILPRRQQVNATTEDDDIKVGYIHEEQRIIDQLVAGEVGLDIVAIVGMAGQGKTTLAQRVFKNDHVQQNFNKYAWCCISEAYDIKEILQVILKNVDKSVSHEELCYLTQEDLADQLRKCLIGHRYLLVLDDMWDAKVWYELKLSFPDNNKGSRILLTSRNRNVASEVKVDCCIVELRPLSREESWNLLQMKVFGEDFCPSILSDIGKTIAKNCKGLPLAIVVVAGLLKKDETVDSWKKISENLKSHIASEGCMDILDLSYKLLPDYLKPCFLYLGAFKEDERIDVKRLIQLWVAEGFVKNDGRKSMEVVANEYLIDLVARSLVFVSQRSSRYGIKRCHVHDLLREFCLIKAKEERFLVLTNMSNNPSSIRCDRYRLCFDSQGEHFADSEPIFPMARSLLVFGNGSMGFYFAHSFWESFKLLWVLDLTLVTITGAEFDEITQFIHLRFLSVVCESSIPSSIVNLSRLEVLRVRKQTRGEVILASVVMKMANLRHVFISECRFGYSKDFTEMQLIMSPPLTNFESLSFLHFKEESSFISLAGKLPNVLKLGLELSFYVDLSSYFRKLESLNLYIGETESISPSPSTLDFPLNIKKLKLYMGDSPLSGAMISSIGKLRNLEVLKLDLEFEDHRWDVEDDEFLKLKYLGLAYSCIKEWNVSEESFPVLEQLVVNYCLRLQELPGRFGAITTLKRIEVVNCNGSVSNSFQQIVDDQIDYGNQDLQSSISYK